MNAPVSISSDNLQSDIASHGFFTRRGGVSTGIYGELNAGLGSDDDKTDVAENRDRIAGVLGVAQPNLLSAHQVHSPDVLIVKEPWEKMSDRPKVDALVTNQPNLAIGVLTADCGPVLFLDAENRVAGAAHAGWKGALTGILENTVSAMVSLGARTATIKATLGPMISAESYEVGPEFVERFIAQGSQNQVWFKPSKKKNHSMFDLPGYIVSRLSQAGIDTIWTGHCTYKGEDQFYSYRRATHRGEPDYGRQISAIALVNTDRRGGQ